MGTQVKSTRGSGSIGKRFPAAAPFDPLAYALAAATRASVGAAQSAGAGLVSSSPAASSRPAVSSSFAGGCGGSISGDLPDGITKAQGGMSASSIASLAGADSALGIAATAPAAMSSMAPSVGSFGGGPSGPSGMSSSVGGMMPPAMGGLSPMAAALLRETEAAAEVPVPADEGDSLEKAGDGVEAIQGLLKKLGLMRYFDKFVESGFDTMAAVELMTEDDMRDECGMAAEHIQALQRWISGDRGSAALREGAAAVAALAAPAAAKSFGMAQQSPAAMPRSSGRASSEEVPANSTLANLASPAGPLPAGMMAAGARAAISSGQAPSQDYDMMGGQSAQVATDGWRPKGGEWQEPGEGGCWKPKADWNSQGDWNSKGGGDWSSQGNWNPKGGDWNSKGGDWNPKGGDWSSKGSSKGDWSSGGDWNPKGGDWNSKGGDWSLKGGDWNAKGGGDWNARGDWNAKADWNSKGDWNPRGEWGAKPEWNPAGEWNAGESAAAQEFRQQQQQQQLQEQQQQQQQQQQQLQQQQLQQQQQRDVEMANAGGSEFTEVVATQTGQSTAPLTLPGPQVLNQTPIGVHNMAAQAAGQNLMISNLPACLRGGAAALQSKLAEMPAPEKLAGSAQAAALGGGGQGSDGKVPPGVRAMLKNQPQPGQAMVAAVPNSAIEELGDPVAVAMAAAQQPGGAANTLYTLAQMAQESAQYAQQAAALTSNPSDAAQAMQMADAAEQAAQRAAWATTAVSAYEPPEGNKSKGDTYISSILQICQQASETAEQAAGTCRTNANNAKAVEEMLPPAGRGEKRSRVFCKFFESGMCQKGANCPLSHNPVDKTPIPLWQKRMYLCTFFADDKCIRGASCAFAHGPEELEMIKKFKAALKDENPKWAKRPGDWDCPQCGDRQFARNGSCRKCGEPKPLGVPR